MRLVLLAVFLLTSPLHAQWILQNSGTAASLRGIHAVGDGRVAWASGTEGTVLRTTDGGSHWTKCAVPPGAEKLDFRGVQAFDAKTALVMSSGKGDLSRVYFTEDSCSTWELLLQNRQPEGFWDGIAAKLVTEPEGTIRGYILGDPVGGMFTLLKFSVFPKEGTIKRRTYVEPDTAKTLAASQVSSSAFAASNSSFLLLTDAYKTYIGPPRPDPKEYETMARPKDDLFFVTGGVAGAHIYTHNREGGGDFILPSRWTIEPLPLGSYSATSGAFSVAFSHDENVAVAVGGDFTHPNETTGTAAFYRRLTGWSASTHSPGGYRSAVARVPSLRSTWITVGPNGTDVSTDDGVSWRALSPAKGDAPDADKNWNALSLPYVVGPKGRIGKLRDGVFLVK